MKYAGRFIFFIICVLCIAKNAWATTNFTLGNTDQKISVACEQFECDFTLSWISKDKQPPANLPFRIWTTNPPKGDSMKYEKVITFPDSKSVSFSVAGLSMGTPYYITYGGNTIYSFKTDTVTQTKGYSLTVSQKDGIISGTYETPASNTTMLLVSIRKPDGTQVVAVNNATQIDTSHFGTHIPTFAYTFGNLTEQTPPGNYTISLVTSNSTVLYGPMQFTLSNPQITADQLKYTANNDSIVVAGRIDPIKNSDFMKFKISFEWSTNRNFPSDGTKGPVQMPALNFKEDGGYTYTISPVDSNQLYFIRQTIVGPTEAQKQTIDPVNSSTGIVPTSGQGAQDEKNQKTYRLLAPLPGLSYVFDPDYCAEQTALGIAIPANAICDINQFLNYMMKLLIGLAGVMLVLRIMYEGYLFMTTDAPYLRASAKAGIGQAVLGLALALTAWIILNTINPQLVSNSISLNDVAAGIESTFTAGGGTYTGGTATPNANTNITTYDAFLHASTTQFGIEYSLAKAHMYAESGGSPNATSNIKDKNSVVVNHAYGLMQLTKATFESLGYDFSMIYDPKTNIEAGVKYMANLKTKGCNNASSNAVCNVSNVSYRIAAYNAGAGANAPSKSCPGKTLWQCDTTNDGYAETRNYVAKVLANQQKIIQKNW